MNYNECLYCGKKFKSRGGLSTHLLNSHNKSFKEYYDDFFKKEYEGVCRNPTCFKETTWDRKKPGYKDFCYNCSRSNDIEVLKIKFPNTWEIELKKRSSNKNTTSLNSFIKRYGKEEGQKKYNKWLKDKAVTEEKYIQKYGKEEGQIKFQEWKESVGVTEEKYIQKYGKEEGQIKFQEWKEIHKNKFSLNWFIERYGEEEGILLYKKRGDQISNQLTLEYFIKLYGEEHGIEKWNVFCEKNRETNQIEYYIVKYGEEEGIRRYEKWRASLKNTKQNFINRYGEEEGIRRYNQFKELLKQRFTLESFIQKYGEDDGIRKYKEYCLSMACSEEKFIKKYGEEEGTRRYEKWLFNIKNKGNQQASKESMNIFFPLIDWLLDEEICTLDEIYVGLPDKKEWFISGKNNIFYRYDFAIPKLKIIIEYNGEGFHPNPLWLESNVERWKSWKCLFSNESAEEKYHFDRTKINFAKKHGFKIIEVWSSDENPIDICKRFIIENL